MSEPESTRLETFVCTTCGAPLSVPQGVSVVTCQHCQTQLAVRRTADPVAHAGDQGAVPLDVVEFLESEEPAAAARPPGPGLPESLLWVLGIFFFQICAGIVGALVFAVGSMIAEPVNSPSDILHRIEDLGPNGALVFFGLPNLFVFVALIGLGCWRLGRPPTHKLNFSPPSYTQLVILASAVFPLGLVADALWKPAQAAWQSFVEQVPWLQFMDETNIMQFMEQINGASLPLLLFFLAVVPAVGEEFMLRGLIGRGLVARWGLFWGVLITSLLFAGLHMYPPHVAAIFPVGIMMHIVYLTTRSFWTPMLFHFMNNGLAALYSALGLTADNGEVAEGTVTDWVWLKYAAPAYVLFCCWLLWRYRTEYVDDAGTPAWPGYHTAEHPAPMLALRRAAPNNLPVALVFTLLLIGQAGLIAYDVHHELQAAPAQAMDAEETVVMDLQVGREGHGTTLAAQFQRT